MNVNPATASLYAVNPLPRQGLATLFMTHPPLAERIRRLRALDGDRALAGDRAGGWWRSVPPATTEPVSLSDELEAWLKGESEKTLGSLVQAFGDKSFAILFVFLLGVPALPLPTGGATHVLEVIAMLIALELIAGRHEVWLPDRWRRSAGRR